MFQQDAVIMFPNREQFGRLIGPMGFAVNTPRNPPLPPPPPPIFALPTQHPIHQTPPPPPTQHNPSATGWTPTHPPPGSFGSPTFAKAKYGLKLLKRVASTPYSQKAGISGCPIEQVPALAIIRHGWSSYWLRYLSNGQDMFPVMSIADAVLASELLSMIRQRKINTDAAATAYAWEHSLPMDRTSAVKALAEDFCDYMEDLIHKKQVAGNASNSAQHTMGTPAAVQAASQGADPASSHRITHLGVAGQGTTPHTASTGQRTRPSQPHHRPKNSGENSNSRENNPGANRPLDTRGGSTRAHPPTSHRARSRGDIRIHPGVPGHRHLLAIRKTAAGSGRTQPSRYTLHPKEETNVFLTGQHAANIRRSSVDSRDRDISLHTSPNKKVAASNADR